MPDLYNLSNYSEFTGMVNVVQTSNNLMGGWLGTLLTIGLFIIVVASTRNFGVKTSFATASFLTFIFSLFFYAMSLISEILVFILILAVAISILILYFSED